MGSILKEEEEKVAEEKMVENKQVIFKGYIKGRAPEETDLEYKVGYMKIDSSNGALKAPNGSGALLVKNLFLSVDPYLRSRMRDFHGSYVPAFVPGSAIDGYGVSRVLDSDDPEFKAGDLVFGFTGWEQYSFIKRDKDLRKIKEDEHIPLSYHAGLLGMPGFTAYVGFYEICTPKKGDYVFVSAAAGAVGHLVGQLAKLHGCYVVGSAGTNHKVDILKNKLGFDDAFNYREEQDFDATLKRYFPNGINIYFDNVGGQMLDAALHNLRPHARVALCGMVSQHSASKSPGLRYYHALLTKRARMQGFLQGDYLHLYPQFLEFISKLYKDGKIIYIEDITEGLENAPAAFIGLFTGENVGKKIIRVSSGDGL